MKRLYVLCFTIIVSCSSQKTIQNNTALPDIENIIRTLSSDEMEGRRINTPGAEKAASFIESEFKNAGLAPLANVGSFRQTFNLTDKQPGDSGALFNVVGMIRGRSRPEEIVIFSAHYDHIGIINPVNGDSIANGADDDASGVTAVIALAHYFKKLNSNERTLLFVAFTAEESGGFGSKYFSQQLDPEKVVAMFNIEMIGKPSKFGNNTAFITGYERSDFGSILQKNLTGSKFTFHPDPYPKQQLFYRSDNATLAALGVPAHTISTDQIDIDPYYHTVGDEIQTLKIDNIKATVEAIALSAASIIAGTDTPSRIPKKAAGE